MFVIYRTITAIITKVKSEIDIIDKWKKDFMEENEKLKEIVSNTESEIEELKNDETKKTKIGN